MFEYGGAADPGAGTLSAQNNLFFECPDAAYVHYDAASAACSPTSGSGNTYACLTAASDLNTASEFGSGSAATRVGNVANETVASFAAMGFANLATKDFHLTTATPLAIRNGGKDAAKPTCGETGADPCAAVAKDRDGVVRSCPQPQYYSLGPYELHSQSD